MRTARCFYQVRKLAIITPAVLCLYWLGHSSWEVCVWRVSIMEKRVPQQNERCDTDWYWGG